MIATVREFFKLGGLADQYQISTGARYQEMVTPPLQRLTAAATAVQLGQSGPLKDAAREPGHAGEVGLRLAPRTSCWPAGTVPSGALTVGAVAAQWLAAQQFGSDITAACTRAHVEKITSAIGTVRLTRLTAGQVEAMLRDLAGRGYSASTISRVRSVLRRALRHSAITAWR